MTKLINTANSMLDDEYLKRTNVDEKDILKPIIVTNTDSTNVEIRKLLNKVKYLIFKKIKNKKIVYYQDIKCEDNNKSGKNKGNRCKNFAIYKRLKDCKYICGVHSRYIEKVELLIKSITYNYFENDDKNIVNIYFYIIRELVTLIIKSFRKYFEKGLNFRLIKFQLLHNRYLICFIIYNNIEYKINIKDFNSNNGHIIIINNIQHLTLFTDCLYKYQKIYELYKELNNNNISFIKFDVIKNICKISYSSRISYQGNANVLYNNLDIMLFNYLLNKNF
uniref:Uncharacterized protein n=1 Tax=Pithovirus LCDPAC02 TaxID=2506601 RepID=A0A481YQB4_9VIRU|nr:MAG: hypothetical protein LCDPAC02_03060 [Pithovirus LCDPAC02]